MRLCGDFTENDDGNPLTPEMSMGTPNCGKKKLKKSVPYL